MALLGNYTIYTKNPIFLSSGDSTTGIQFVRYNFNQAGDSRLRFYGDNDVSGVTDRCGLPANYSSPYSWILPQKSGGIGSNVGVRGSGAFNGSGALGINIDSTMEGSGTISDANLGLILSAVATLSGIGGLSSNVIGALQASATLAGQGDFTASLGALAGAVATLSGSATMIGDITAIGSMSADIYVNQSEASVQQIVDGVWNALATNYNTIGTMGEATQAGGGGGGYTPAQIWAYTNRTLTESAGLSTEEHDKLMSITVGGGGVSINYQAINSHTTSKINEAKEELEKRISEIPQVSLEGIEKTLNEIDSQNSIAKEEILDRIDSLENEVCSDVVRKSKEIKEDNIKTRNLIREKTKKINDKLDKDEKEEEESNDVKELLEDFLEKEEQKEIEDLIDRMDAEEIDKLLT